MSEKLTFKQTVELLDSTAQVVNNRAERISQRIGEVASIQDKIYNELVTREAAEISLDLSDDDLYDIVNRPTYRLEQTAGSSASHRELLESRQNYYLGIGEQAENFQTKLHSLNDQLQAVVQNRDNSLITAEDAKAEIAALKAEYSAVQHQYQEARKTWAEDEKQSGYLLHQGVIFESDLPQRIKADQSEDEVERLGTEGKIRITQKSRDVSNKLMEMLKFSFESGEPVSAEQILEYIYGNKLTPENRGNYLHSFNVLLVKARNILAKQGYRVVNTGGKGPGKKAIYHLESLETNDLVVDEGVSGVKQARKVDYAKDKESTAVDEQIYAGLSAREIMFLAHRLMQSKYTQVFSPKFGVSSKDQVFEAGNLQLLSNLMEYNGDFISQEKSQDERELEMKKFTEDILNKIYQIVEGVEEEKYFSNLTENAEVNKLLKEMWKVKQIKFEFDGHQFDGITFLQLLYTNYERVLHELPLIKRLKNDDIRKKEFGGMSSDRIDQIYPPTDYYDFKETKIVGEIDEDVQKRIRKEVGVEYDFLVVRTDNHWNIYADELISIARETQLPPVTPELIDGLFKTKIIQILAVDGGRYILDLPSAAIILHYNNRGGGFGMQKIRYLHEWVRSFYTNNK